MNPAMIDKIVQAMLYEGYVLYPYRPSSVKNRSRWTFGGLYPKAYSDASANSDHWFMQAQCLIRGPADAFLQAEVRFLHLTRRTSLWGGDEWQEAVERRTAQPPVGIGDLLTGPVTAHLGFPEKQTIERHKEGAGAIIRRQYAVAGAMTISARQCRADVFQIGIRVENRTDAASAAGLDRSEASLQSLASTHLVLNVEGGDFVSATDPPPELSKLASACENVGCWPVLVGDPGEQGTMLVSPIILYDYPQVAAESPGDLFDGTEIDEILSLRILTLTDEEKRHAAANDERVRRMLARTDALAQQQLLSLHGTIRGMQPGGTA